MEIQQLGHVVLKVRELERSERFYTKVLGLAVAARMDAPPMTFFTLGNHHDFAVMQRGDAAPAQGDLPVGLDHVAFKIGDTLDELREAKAKLEAAGLKLQPVDHEVTKSLYLADPDGNGVELYVDASDVWKREPQRVAQLLPLEL